MLFYIACALVVITIALAILQQESIWLGIGAVAFVFVFGFGVTVPALAIGATHLGDSKNYALQEIQEGAYLISSPLGDDEIQFVYKNEKDFPVLGTSNHEDTKFSDDIPKHSVTLIDQYGYNPWLAPWKWGIHAKEVRYNLSEDEIITIIGVDE